MQVLVTRTGDRNPRYARGKPHQEIQSEILTCGLQSSHTETDDQKIPIVLNDYRDFLVSQLQTKSNLIYTLSTALLSLSITLLNSNITNNIKKLQLKN
ncbi:MAG: hypothetical protein IJ363_06975 [Clostridia bacterium]|nr:hypothetical protein [Clostridia bacterium]